MQNIYRHDGTFTLESGEVLEDLTISYHTYGTINQSKSNVIWICHALTANADAADWWSGLFGESRPFDPSSNFIICANILGSCYGTTGPTGWKNDVDNQQGRHSFPFISIRDMVKAHILLRDHLGIEKIALLAGGSMGGYQCLEWAFAEPERIDKLFLLATSATESTWGIGIHTAQRLAIEADPSFFSREKDGGARGLKAARAIGLLTYRNYDLFKQQQTDKEENKTDLFKVSSYLEYQGDKLVKRFNAWCYWTLTKAMDSHHLSRNRNIPLQEAIQKIKSHTLLIGISSDILCPPQEQQYLASHLPNCYYKEINSDYGHDGFLVETEKIADIFNVWLSGLNSEAEVV